MAKTNDPKGSIAHNAGLGHCDTIDFTKQGVIYPANKVMA